MLGYLKWSPNPSTQRARPDGTARDARSTARSDPKTDGRNDDDRPNVGAQAFEIHYTLPSGADDYVVVSGDTLEDIRDDAKAAVEKRHGTDPWSRQIGGPE